MNAKASQRRTIVAAFAFALIGLSAFVFAPTREIAMVLNLLLLTVFLFAFEVVGVDVAAVSIMVLLGLISHFGDLGSQQNSLDLNTNLLTYFFSDKFVVTGNNLQFNI